MSGACNLTGRNILLWDASKGCPYIVTVSIVLCIDIVLNLLRPACILEPTYLLLRQLC